MLGLKKKATGKEIKLSSLQEDTLIEIGNLASAKAVDSLAKISKTKAKIKVSKIKLIPISRFSSVILAPKQVIVSTFVNLFKDYSCGVLILYKKATTLALVDSMLQRKIGQTKQLAGEDISAFLEFSNILINTYISTVANFFEIKIKPSNPQVVLDVEFILNTLQQKSGKDDFFATIISTKFFIEQYKGIEGEFIFIFDARTLREFLERIDKSVNQKGKKIF